MDTSQHQLSELARNNKTAMTAHFIDSLVMLTFCVLQAAAGLVSWLYVLITLLLGLGPVAIEYTCWRKNQETGAIKHLAAIGFAVFYTFILFTATNLLVFVFVIPMILVISIYNDVRASIMITVGIVVENLLVAIIGAATGKFGYLGQDYAIIQVVCMILIGVYSLFTTKTLNQNSAQKVANVKEAQGQTETVLRNLSQLSEELTAGVEDIYTELEKLNASSLTTRRAMQEVAAGANDTAQAVANQLQQTESIQRQVDMVVDATGQISGNMQQTLTVLESGSKDVDLLVHQVNTSVQNGADVANMLQTLDQYIKEMNSIVELISGIAHQTALLSLNASIEAARAGEAGRGFAVVASEISAMAAQTNDATTHITNLIQNVSSSITEVVNVIYQMIDGINEEKQSTEHAAGSFDSIQNNTLSIRDNVDHLATNIADLKNANHVIADSIQTISAISQEVSAHAAETMNAEEENEAILDHISQKMQELMALIKH